MTDARQADHDEDLYLSEAHGDHAEGHADEPDEPSADPLDAPPLPFRTAASDPSRFAYNAATPLQPRIRPLLPPRYRRRPDEVAFVPVQRDEPEEPEPEDWRDRLPPLIPEGRFNPGVAMAWGVALVASALVMAWHAGPTLLFGG